MKSITDILIVSLSAFITLLTVGKLYAGTKSYIADLALNDFGSGWVPFILIIWFVLLLFFLFSGCAYLLKKLEIILNGKLARLIRIR